MCLASDLESLADFAVAFYMQKYVCTHHGTVEPQYNRPLYYIPNHSVLKGTLARLRVTRILDLYTRLSRA